MRRLLLAALPLLVAAGEPGPTGTFEVVAVPRNPIVSNAAAAYRDDDPQLIGRLVTLRGAAVSFDGDYKDCRRAAVTTTRMTLAAAVRGAMPPRAAYGRTRVIRPVDLGLRQPPATPVAVTRYRCQVAGTHGADWTGATLFPVGGGRMALALIDDHLLILRPVTGPIRASFPCARARSPVERTICSDRLLAGWDRSVAAAFAAGNGDVDAQRAWLAERDRCGADKACLHESMSLRTLNLLQ